MSKRTEEFLWGLSFIINAILTFLMSGAVWNIWWLSWLMVMIGGGLFGYGLTVFMSLPEPNKKPKLRVAQPQTRIEEVRIDTVSDWDERFEQWRKEKR